MPFPNDGKIGLAAVIFDLDGTLLDTLEGIERAMNGVLEEFGFPLRDRKDYLRFVGEGARTMVRRALPESGRDEETVEKGLIRYKQNYSRIWREVTKPYPGIPELLESLEKRGISLAVLSNKSHEAVVELIPHYFGGNSFRAVQGARDGMALKPDPTQVLEIAGEVGAAPARCAYLGDMDVDMQTAANAGMTAVGAAWGFRGPEQLKASGADIVLHEPMELLEYL